MTAETTIVLPPRALWHDRFLLKIAALSQTWPLALTTAAVGIMECVLNLWQLTKQRDLVSQSKKRRLLWIEQAKSVSSSGRRVAIVTGGNTGLGYETAKALVEAGFITVIACRSVAKGQAAIDNIEAQTGIKGKLSVISLDLSSQKSVKAFVLEFKALGHQHLDVLVNNAGVMDLPLGFTEEGLEMQFGVNHIGHYVLTLQLLPLINKAPKGRIVVLTSCTLYSSADINYDLLKSSKGYSRLGHYSNSKLANAMFAKALNRRLQQAHSKVTVNACHPGACSTELFRNNAFMNLVMAVSRICCRSALVGAMSSIYLALAPELDNVSGEYFFDQIPRTPSPVALNEKSQELLWAKSVEYTGIDFKL